MLLRASQGDGGYKKWNNWLSSWQVLDYSPVLGSFLIGSCIVFMTFVVLNLFISVILVAFSEEQKYDQVNTRS